MPLCALMSVIFIIPSYVDCHGMFADGVSSLRFNKRGEWIFMQIFSFPFPLLSSEIRRHTHYRCKRDVKSLSECVYEVVMRTCSDCSSMKFFPSGEGELSIATTTTTTGEMSKARCNCFFGFKWFWKMMIVTEFLRCQKISRNEKCKGTLTHTFSFTPWIDILVRFINLHNPGKLKFFSHSASVEHLFFIFR